MQISVYIFCNQQQIFDVSSVYLPACVISVKFCFANLSLHTLQPATNFWRFVCLPVCLRHISQNLATTPVIETARKTFSLRRKFKNRQCIWSFQCQVQFFWQNRKLVNASDRFNVWCSLLAKHRKFVNAFNRLSVGCSPLATSSNYQSTSRLAAQSALWSAFQVSISANVFHQQT